MKHHTDSKDAKRKKRDEHTHTRTNWVTTSLLELLIAAKKMKKLIYLFQMLKWIGLKAKWESFLREPSNNLCWWQKSRSHLKIETQKEKVFVLSRYWDSQKLCLGLERSRYTLMCVLCMRVCACIWACVCMCALVVLVHFKS